MLILMLNASTVESFYKALVAAKFPFKMTKIKLLVDHCFYICELFSSVMCIFTPHFLNESNQTLWQNAVLKN